MNDNSHQRGFWRLARVQKLMTGIDRQTRGTVIHVQSKGEKGTTTLRPPVMHLYPLEASCEIEKNVGETTRTVNPVELSATPETHVNDPQPQSIEDLRGRLLKELENGCRLSSIANSV